MPTARRLRRSPPTTCRSRRSSPRSTCAGSSTPWRGTCAPSGNKWGRTLRVRPHLLVRRRGPAHGGRRLLLLRRDAHLHVLQVRKLLARQLPIAVLVRAVEALDDFRLPGGFGERDVTVAIEIERIEVFISRRLRLSQRAAGGECNAQSGDGLHCPEAVAPFVPAQLVTH